MNARDSTELKSRLAQPQSRAPGKLHWEATAEDEAGVNSLPPQAQVRLKVAPSWFNQRVVDYYSVSPLVWD